MVQSVQPLRILVVPIMAVGHVNACSGVAKHLLKRGHRVAFFVDQTFAGKLKPLGFEEYVYHIEYETKAENPGDDMSEKLITNNVLGEPDILEQLKKVGKMFMDKDYMRSMYWNADEELKKLIPQFQPDLFIIDGGALLPSIHQSGKPWIQNVSIVPLFYFNDCENLPPGCSGFPIDSDKKDWIPFKKVLDEMRICKEYNDLIEEMGYNFRYPNDSESPGTQSFNIYASPEEYAYPQIIENEMWFNIEVFNKNESQKTIDLKDLIPKSFYEDDLAGEWSGKYIYVSMGSMGSADLNFMNRLLEVLGKTNHKYIVSKGPRHKEYELKPNMWGDRFLPQTQILPSVDLVITHGGNNTITETFAQGKPMIVLPLFVDQHDNAQRIHETGFGIKLSPYTFTEEQLISSIYQLLKDEELNLKLRKASERILKSNKHEILCDKIEQIVEKSIGF